MTLMQRELQLLETRLDHISAKMAALKVAPGEAKGKSGRESESNI
jgi:hypothetical protein